MLGHAFLPPPIHHIYGEPVSLSSWTALLRLAQHVRNLHAFTLIPFKCSSGKKLPSLFIQPRFSF